MRKGIHPEYVDTVVTCTCGNVPRSPPARCAEVLGLPPVRGKQKILDTGGRVVGFEPATASKFL